MTPETSPAPGIKRTSHVELTPGRKEGQHSVWDALTGIFEDLDRQGGGAEAEELEDTLDELRGLLEMHTQLRGKAVELEASRRRGENWTGAVSRQFLQFRAGSSRGRKHGRRVSQEEAHRDARRREQRR